MSGAQDNERAFQKARTKTKKTDTTEAKVARLKRELTGFRALEELHAELHLMDQRRVEKAKADLAVLEYHHANKHDCEFTIERAAGREIIGLGIPVQAARMSNEENLKKRISETPWPCPDCTIRHNTELHGTLRIRALEARLKEETDHGTHYEMLTLKMMKERDEEKARAEKAEAALAALEAHHGNKHNCDWQYERAAKRMLFAWRPKPKV